MYYRCDFDSTEVAQEVGGINPPAVRQILARLGNAANGKVYCSPKHQRIKEAKAEMRRVADLFPKLSKIVDATKRNATEAELRAIMADVQKRNTPGSAWTLGRLRFVYMMRLQKKDWDFIAKKLGVRLGGSVRQGFNFYFRNMHLLWDSKWTA